MEMKKTINKIENKEVAKIREAVMSDMQCTRCSVYLKLCCILLFEGFRL